MYSVPTLPQASLPEGYCGEPTADAVWHWLAKSWNERRTALPVETVALVRALAVPDARLDFYEYWVSSKDNRIECYYTVHRFARYVVLLPDNHAIAQRDLGMFAFCTSPVPVVF